MSAKVRRLRERLAALEGLPDDEREDLEDMLDDAEDADTGGLDISAGLARIGRMLDRAKDRATPPAGGAQGGPRAPQKRQGSPGGDNAARQARRGSWFGS